jgi:hypothetical protein
MHKEKVVNDFETIVLETIMTTMRGRGCQHKNYVTSVIDDLSQMKYKLLIL